MNDNLGRWVMEMADRYSLLLLGCFIGYFVRVLHERIRDKQNARKPKNEDGFARFPLVLDVLIIALFAMTAWSALRVEVSVDRSNKAVEALEEEQVADERQDARIEAVASCTLEYTSKTINALNARTTTTADQLKADVRVLKSQLEFLEAVLTIPPVHRTVRRAALEAYFEDAKEFVEVTSQQRTNIESNDFPTNEELSDCLGTKVTAAEEKNNDERERGTDSGDQ